MLPSSNTLKLNSHPGKLLLKHLENVGKYSENTVKSKVIEKFDKDIFSNISYLIGISHDFGKATTYFQKMLNDNVKSKNANHGFISSLFGYWLTKKYLNELNKYEKLWYIPIIVWVVILKHHGNIKDVGNPKEGEIAVLCDNEIDYVKKQINDIKKNNLQEIECIYKNLTENLISELRVSEFLEIFNFEDSLKSFIKRIREDAINISKKEELDYYFYLLFFYSILLDADKLDASETILPERMDVSSTWIDNYKESKYGNANTRTHIEKEREQAYREVIKQIENDVIKFENNRVLSLNLPTGCGKTLIGISFALKLRDKIKNKFNFNPRIIYCLPFLSIIDQNSKVMEDVLKTTVSEIPSNLFLIQHHLADTKYKEENNGELNIIENIHRSSLLIEGWNSEIIFTTFIQFFYGVITNRNRTARKFHNIINSIIILDEVQSIPHKYWHLIKLMLNYLTKKFNCWVILMTATQPLIFSKEDVKSLVKDKKSYFENFDRIEYKFDLKEKKFVDFKEEIFNEIIKENNKNKDIMIVLNTIGASTDMYMYLKKKLYDEYKRLVSQQCPNIEECLDTDGIYDLPELELIYLSTHILPTFRLKRIDRIKNDTKRKIIITTQLVEAGVDISVDIIYRDIAPIDSIIQTAGRCNRNNKKDKGIVNVILLKDDNGKQFSSYIYDTILMDITKEVIGEITENNNKISEKDFNTIAADKYYTKTLERTNNQNSEDLINNIKRLKFSNIYDNFKLIENDLQTITIFIETDECARHIREEMEKVLCETKSFERNGKLLKLKKEANLYIISINYTKKLESKVDRLSQIGEISDFKYVEKERLDKWYRKDIGFCLPEGETYVDYNII